MNGDIEQLALKRQKWVEANRENNFEHGIKRLLTELYPEDAHFIYELLQNAEDTGATKVSFTLDPRGLEFEHNGSRLFSFADVDAITSIGVSTKRDDPTSIGKFGVGFKAVFANTNTPEIHSGEFHFRIHDLVVPETNGIKKPNKGERETRFIFPFDRQKKPSAQAMEEVERGLRALGDNTLLFLSHINTIEYLLPDGSLGSLECIAHDGGHIEIRASHPGGKVLVSHWLRFQKDVEVIDENGKPKSCRIAIAYSLAEEEDKKKFRSTWKIIPLDHGQVSIYFPAEKETSNLRFHLHAPFASTVARDCVRDCKANHQLRDHLAALVADSLIAIRDQGMLTVNFLAVLPIAGDNLSEFYNPIMEALIMAFQKQDLTPTIMGGHAPAGDLYRGPAAISRVINDKDLALLMGDGSVPPMWAANPPLQNQRADGFLDSLEIDEWGWSELVTAIKKPYPYQNQPQYIEDNKQRKHLIENWIAQKEDDWLMRFYALLGEACDVHYETVDVSDLRIVRVEADQGAEHVTPKEAFFSPDEETTAPPDIRFVKPTVYSIGKSEQQKKFASLFLEKIGVRPFDAKAVIELRLARYESPPEQFGDGYYKDLKQFISYLKKNPNEASLFSGHTFLLGVPHDGGLNWCKPDQLCLDNPFLETGLAELTKIHEKDVVWKGYQDKLIESELIDLTEFLKEIGVMYELEVKQVYIAGNPRADELKKDYGYRTTYTCYAINYDYSISNIDKYLVAQSISASRLIWDALINADAKCAKARFRPNSNYNTREEESQLVYHLKRHAWIPDKSGTFHKPQDMTKDDLLTSFPYIDINGLLPAIGFGENNKKCSEDYKAQNLYAQNLGFVSGDRANKWAEIDKLGISPDQVIAQFKPVMNNGKPVFPKNSVSNPERSQERLEEQLSGAPEREHEKRERSVRTTRGAVDPSEWLRKKYTNDYGQMMCQICKKVMPFNKRDGEYYFEAVEAFSGDHFEKEHEAQFLALCPLCAAMYKEFVKQDKNAMKVFKNALMNSENPEVSLQLGVLSTSIRFVEKHWHDFKFILQKGE